MKTTNYLHLEFRRTLKKFQKLQQRFEKRIANGTLGEITAQKRYYLIRKIEKLKEKLNALAQRLKLAGVVGALGMAFMSTDADAQTAAGTPMSEVTSRELVNTTTIGDQENPKMAMNDAGDIVIVWEEGTDIKGQYTSAEGIQSSEFTVYTPVSGDYSVNAPAVTIDQGGDFVVAYDERHNDGTPYSHILKMERFEGDTQIGDGSIDVADLEIGDGESATDQLSIAIQPDGDVMIAYTDYYYDDEVYSYYDQVKVAYVPSSNIAQITNLSIDNKMDASFPSLAMDDDGNGIVVWAERSYDYGDYVSDINYRRFKENDLFASTTSMTLKHGAGGEGRRSFYRPDVDINDDGDFVIGWERNSYSWDYPEIQKYDADGNPVGDLIALTGYSYGYDGQPKVAIDDIGGFIVAFQIGNSNTDLLTRRYNKHGIFIEEFNTNLEPTHNQNLSVPSVSITDDGEFAVVWSDNKNTLSNTGTDQTGMAVYKSTYDFDKESGHDIIKELAIEGIGNFNQDIKIASDADGDYVVIWDALYLYNQDIIYTIGGQRFNASGKKEGDIFNVYQIYNDPIQAVDVDMNNDGSFAVVWKTSSEITKRYFNHDATPVVGTFIPVATLSSEEINDVSIALDETGNFSVVTWVDTVTDRVYINPSETTAGIQIVNNSIEDIGDINSSDVAMGIDDNYIVVWDDKSDLITVGDFFDYSSIHYRRFKGESALSDISIAVDQGNFEGKNFRRPQVSTNRNTGDFAIGCDDGSYTFLTTFDKDASVDLELFDVSGAGQYSNIELDMNGDSEISVAYYGYQEGPYSFFKKYNKAGQQIVSEKMLSGGVQDVAVGREKSIVLTGEDGEIRQSIFADPPSFEFSEFPEEKVNTTIIGEQKDAQIATNSHGEMVVVWLNSSDQQYYAQVYDSNGEVYGSEIQVSENAQFEKESRVAMDDNGDIMIAWSTYNSGYYNIQAQIMNRNGAGVINDFNVSSEEGSQDSFDLDIDSNGNFIVVWSELFLDGQDQNSNIIARRFDKNGSVDVNNVPLFSTTGNNNVRELAIDFNSAGVLGLSYRSLVSTKNYIYVKSFNTDLSESNSGSVLITEINDASYVKSTSIITDNSGDFIVSTNTAGNDLYQDMISLHRFKSGSTSIAETACTAFGIEADITIADNDQIVLVYQRKLDSRDFESIYTARVDSDFNPIGSEYKLNEVSTQSTYPKVISTSSGVFKSVWESNRLDGYVGTIAVKEFFSYVPIIDSSEFPAGLPVDEGGSASNFTSIMTSDIFNFSGLSTLQFEFSVLPDNGELDLEGIPLTLDASLTKEEFETIRYTHDDGETSLDSFSFFVSNGTFDSKPYEFLFPINPINDIPVLDVKETLTLDEGDSQSFYEMLYINDPDNTGDEETYTIKTLPQHGSLWNVEDGDFQLSIDNTFSQNDVGFGYIEYRHDGREGTTDSFEFTIGDLDFTSTNLTFDISINPVNDDPTLDTNVAFEVNEGETNVISNSILQANDADHVATEISYIVNSIGDLPSFGEIRLNDVGIGTDVVFTQDDIDNSRVTYVHGGNEDSVVDSFIFDISDPLEGTLTGQTFNINITYINDTPAVDALISNQNATEDIAFSFEVPVGTFSDEETSVLTLTALQSDGNDLPTWLSFDGTTFSGTPLEGDGDVEIELTATDEGDPALSIATTFTITVTPVNETPVVANAISNPSATEDIAFSFEVPVGTFSDEETSVLTLTALQSDGNDLPTWLSFDGTTFSGTPLEGDGDVEIELTATDEGDPALSVFTEFTILINSVNDAPVVDMGIPDELVVGYGEFSFSVPSNAFSDIEGNDLIYSATLDDDSPLPSFISFDEEQRIFSGQAFINVDEGEYDIKVTVTEDSDDQLSISTTFKFTVEAVLSVNQELDMDVSIYPNPTSEKLNAKIENGNFGEYRIQLIDQTGKIVAIDQFQKNRRSFDYQLDVSALKKGLYLLQLSYENTSVTYRIQKD
ncbi:MAG: putative Ig domain-containing protein [Reichenbachiella sp.]